MPISEDARKKYMNSTVEPEFPAGINPISADFMGNVLARERQGYRNMGLPPVSYDDLPALVNIGLHVAKQYETLAEELKVKIDTKEAISAKKEEMAGVLEQIKEAKTRDERYELLKKAKALHIEAQELAQQM